MIKTMPKLAKKGKKQLKMLKLKGAEMFELKNSKTLAKIERIVAKGK